MTELEIANDICLGKLRVPDETRFVNDPRDLYPSDLSASQMLANAFVCQLRAARRAGFDAGRSSAAEIVRAADYPELAEKIARTE